jgi:hypothetical protein
MALDRCLENMCVASRMRWLLACLVLLPLCGCATSKMADNTDPLGRTVMAVARLPENLGKAVKPSNDRHWAAEQAVLAHAQFDDNMVTVHNIRNCTYQTAENFEVKHYDKTFDLERIESVDFIMVPFPDNPSIGHTMLSFGFEGGEHLALSVEIRKEQGEAYSAVNGFFRQYEIMYVLGDERDLVGLRANHWLNDVYVYRAKATRQQTRELFVDVLRRANKLAGEPEFYDTLANNCTTNIADHINNLSPDRVPFDYRALLPGYSDELAYDLGLLDTDLSFEETKTRARVNRLAYVYRNSDDFSKRIRQ